MVGPEYFANMRTPILSGRGFTEADTATSQLVAVVNQTMARHLWPNQDPIGHKFSYDGEKPKARSSPSSASLATPKTPTSANDRAMFFYVPTNAELQRHPRPAVAYCRSRPKP